MGSKVIAGTRIELLDLFNQFSLQSFRRRFLVPEGAG